jgi:hypothetical protein
VPPSIEITLAFKATARDKRYNAFRDVFKTNLSGRFPHVVIGQRYNERDLSPSRVCVGQNDGVQIAAHRAAP